MGNGESSGNSGLKWPLSEKIKKMQASWCQTQNKGCVTDVNPRPVVGFGSRQDKPCNLHLQ